ncbi:Conserved hypothetical membrane protein [Candidatus Protochlamydia naegleriophila]|uniref:Conserved hypothetical membrane protein n=1 Tax=Candidatus Protochlamydia naegleriophila TaxID=389348 RepID=A0A0U5JGU0_9BACT|nr:RING-H2 finger protein [Candidatus Protochlamydia naegleriophila]CUI17631.1 Conserved hypothetical membrane protein [Candidatus Protochlamydia naegleriophila]
MSPTENAADIRICFCMDAIESEDDTITLTCGHTWHLGCMTNWSKTISRQLIEEKRLCPSRCPTEADFKRFPKKYFVRGIPFLNCAIIGIVAGTILFILFRKCSSIAADHSYCLAEKAHV